MLGEIKVLEELEEPCNCGNQIRHNNGGNYHEIIKLIKYKNKLYVFFTDTRELFPSDDYRIVDRKNKLQED